MLRRTAFALLAVLAVAAGRAEAVTIRDVIELSKAGLSEEVLLALIEVDGSIFAIDATTVKQLRAAGVTDPVIVALIRSGRTPRAQEPVPQPEPLPPVAPERVIVIEHPAPPPVAVPYPVAVPVYLTAPSHRSMGRNSLEQNTILTTFSSENGVVRARVPVPPNCVKAEPVYWGFGGKLRPGSWEPPPTVVCR